MRRHCRDPEAFRKLLCDPPAFLGVIRGNGRDFGIYPHTGHGVSAEGLFDAVRSPEAAKTMFAAPHLGITIVDFRRQVEAHKGLSYRFESLEFRDASVASDLDFMINYLPRPRRRKKAALA